MGKRDNAKAEGTRGTLLTQVLLRAKHAKRTQRKIQKSISKRLPEKRQRASWRSTDVLRTLLAIIFLSAAAYRIFHYGAALSEVQALHLPGFASALIILFEVTIGLLFLLKLYLDLALELALYTSIVFIAGALIIAIAENWNTIIKQLSEIFFFSPTPTDILVHALYLFLLVQLLHETRKE